MRSFYPDVDHIEDGPGQPMAYVATIIEGHLYLDGKRKRNIGGSISHSHEPNAELFVVISL